MSIAQNIAELKKGIPDNVTLVAVSKTKTEEEILEAYHSGHRIFGENKAQELTSKYEKLPKDIEWHFIGHLQSNKVKYIAPFVRLMHGVDSLKLLKVINKEAGKNERVISCLLQFHIAEEKSKFGLTSEKAIGLLESEAYAKMKNVKITGVMGMATFTDDMNKVRAEFRTLRETFEWLKSDYFSDSKDFNEISMGMSDDYPVAIDEGSTIIRVGSKIFGARNYS